MIDLKSGLVDHRQLSRFFTGNSGFIANHRCFDLCGVDGNNVTASLGCWENKFGRRF
jgi:hypothetical protein